MKRIKKLLRWSAAILLGLFLASIGLIVFFRLVPVPITPLMIIRLVEQAVDKEKEIKLSKHWVSIRNISGHVPMAVIAAEDQKFMDHTGFDKEAIKNALEGNKSGKTIKGGSTISNQTAKNVFLWPARNWLRKGLEAYMTIWMELFWSKERIMEVYLNVIEMGEGIYGIEAASQAYYNKSADKLTRNEAAMIAAILPNPRRWNPAKPTPYLYSRQAWILGQMNNLAPVSFVD